MFLNLITLYTGFRVLFDWIPAFAGMTKDRDIVVKEKMKRYFLKRFLKMAITIAVFHFLLSSILSPFCISTRLAGTQSPLLSEFHVINHLAYLLMGVLSFPLGILAKVAPTPYSFLKLLFKGIPIWFQVEVLLLLNSLLAASIISACFVSVSTFMELIKNQTTEEEHSDSSDSENITGL